MKQLGIQGSGGRGESGQMLPLIALSLVVLIGFVGMAIDLGFAYVTRSRLSKAADAAALAGMENIPQGLSTAGSIATATFYANYAGGAKQTSLDKGPVVPTLTFSPNSAAATQLTVSATTSIQTFFSPVVGLFGNRWTQLSIGDASVVSRGHLDLTLVLDKSTSLAGNGGQTEMYPAVTNFLSFFSDSLDKAALVTFANIGTINVAMSSPFVKNIGTTTYSIYVKGNGFGGGTDSPAGMTNGLAIENSIPIPSTSNLVKAVVFFTDGKANEIQAKMKCSKVSYPNLIFGGHDAGDNCISYFDTAGNSLGNGGPGGCGSFCESPGDSTTFASLHGAGGMLALTADNIRDESQDRCITYAQQMRDNKTVVYTIGLGNAVDVNFLQIAANDPDSSGYLATPYDGIYVPATNSTDMVAAFQRVAENLVERLIH